MRIDLSRKNMNMFFKDWQVEVLNELWGHEEGANCKTLNRSINRTEKKIARTSIYIFLSDLAEKNMINVHEVVSKGGSQKVFTHIYEKPGFIYHLMENTLTSFNEFDSFILTKVMNSLKT